MIWPTNKRWLSEIAQACLDQYSKEQKSSGEHTGKSLRLGGFTGDITPRKHCVQFGFVALDQESQISVPLQLFIDHETGMVWLWCGCRLHEPLKLNVCAK